MATKKSSHRMTLDAIKRTSARGNILHQNRNPHLACRREYRREATNQRVVFTLLDSESREVAQGSAILLDYSPDGALLGHIIFDEGFWPDSNFTVRFSVTNGPFEGVACYGKPLRFAASQANLALSFNSVYVKL